MLGITTLGPWTLEAAAGVTFFTHNDQFFGRGVRRQDPLYAMQAHAIYNFSRSLWAALDGTDYTGGRTTVKGKLGDDRQNHTRWAAGL